MPEASVDNILRTWYLATDADLDAGTEWYADAHVIASLLAKRHNVSVRQAAGVIAALSPRVSWDLNVRNAETLLRTGTCPGILGFVAKAQRIAQGQDPLNVLGGAKVRSFFGNILDPVTSRDVTIDRHAFDVLHGVTGDDVSRKALERKGTYEACAEAYREAGCLLGVPASMVQAVTWVTWRRTKA